MAWRGLWFITCVCVFVCVYIYIYMCVRACICVYVYVYVRVYVYACVVHAFISIDQARLFFYLFYTAVDAITPISTSASFLELLPRASYRVSAK